MVYLKNLTHDGFLIDSYMKIMRVITSRVATIPVCVSFHARAELNGLYPAMQNRLQVIYHGVNHELYSPGKPDSDMIKKYGILNDYILSISNRFIWKNYYRLVKAFSELRKKPGMETTDLVLIGEKKNDFEEQRILEFIKCNNLEKSIKIIPFIDQKELHNFYKGAKAYVFSSMEETFGLTILEAMSTEIPCVCACWGVIPEIAGTAAAYFNPLDINNMCDVIYEVCNNQEFREKLKLFGKTQCQNFSWNRCAESYRKLLLELTKKGKYSGMCYE